MNQRPYDHLGSLRNCIRACGNKTHGRQLQCEREISKTNIISTTRCKHKTTESAAVSLSQHLVKWTPSTNRKNNTNISESQFYLMTCNILSILISPANERQPSEHPKIPMHTPPRTIDRIHRCFVLLPSGQAENENDDDLIYCVRGRFRSPSTCPSPLTNQ